MRTPAPADLQRWSEEVARDPDSLAFLPLAQAYRRQGKREAALRLCLRGLERHPAHVEAHALLARLYLEEGDREKACDEWAIVLRLDPENFEAHRGLGFAYLERGQYGAARDHLERAAAVRPGDPAVREALAFLEELQPSSNGQREATERPEPPAAATPGVHDPRRVFEPLMADASFLGALVLDEQGLVLVGTLAPDQDVDALGATLGGAVHDEATRTATHLGLGAWKGILLETTRALIHLSPLGSGLVLLVALRRDTPAGWARHAASRAAELARGFLEGRA
ncbi:MAG TPA: tetratricopeptide repeat protein [Longimicrobiales bacterium]